MLFKCLLLKTVAVNPPGPQQNGEMVCFSCTHQHWNCTLFLPFFFSFLFCHLLTKKISSFGTSEASRLTPGFITVSFLCLRKQKAGCFLPPALLSKNRIILRPSESPPTFCPADSRALTVMLSLLHLINRTLSKSFSVTTQKEPSYKLGAEGNSNCISDT